MNFLKNIFCLKTLTKVKKLKLLPFAATFFIALFCANAFSTTPVLCEIVYSEKNIKESIKESLKEKIQQGDLETTLLEIKDSPNQLFELALMFYNGDGVTQDYEVAVDAFFLAAQKGLKEAQRNLGFMYHLGYGVEKKDDKLANFWWEKAAEEEEKEAQKKP